MKKKTILSSALALSVAAILAVGGSLAYFTDNDAKDNVFTMGNVDIRLDEEFEQNSKLYPGEEKDAVTKKVDVTNTGSEEAYVRVHIAVPSELDNNEYIHLVKPKDGSKWDWAESTYTTTIKTEEDEQGDGIEYNVYVATYQDPLAAEAKTAEPAITSVYMDKKVTNEILAALEEDGILTASESDSLRSLNIKVMAEGVQTAGFGSAAAAFTAALPYDGNSNPFIGYSNQ